MVNPFLHYFITSQARHALIIKQSYLEETNEHLSDSLAKQSIRKK